MPIANLHGVQLYYEQHGRGDDLVCIGGLSADHTVWRSVVDELTKHFRVLLFDNRGAGQSDAPDGSYTIQMMADDTSHLMEKLSIRRAHFIGHSMGGAIVQQLCLTHPEKIASAAICASAAAFPFPSLFHVRTLIKYYEASLEPSLVCETAFPWLFGESFLRDTKGVVEMMKLWLENPHPQTLNGFKAQVAACVSFDLRKQLHHIQVPTLVVSGKEDRLAPLECSQELQRSISGATLEVIDDCGHMLQLEQSQKFCEIIRTFVELQK